MYFDSFVYIGAQVDFACRIENNFKIFYMQKKLFEFTDVIQFIWIG